MPVPSRKSLPHAAPWWLDPSQEAYFITISCHERGTNQLALPPTAAALFETVKHRQARQIWWPHLWLLMPDHLHTLISFPPSNHTLQNIIRKWKEWTAKRLGIQWQRDFFEHRLRDPVNLRDKAAYILENPVRKKLVSRPQDWPYVYFAAGEPWLGSGGRDAALRRPMPR